MFRDRDRIGLLGENAESFLSEEAPYQILHCRSGDRRGCRSKFCDDVFFTVTASSLWQLKLLFQVIFLPTTKNGFINIQMTCVNVILVCFRPP